LDSLWKTLQLLLYSPSQILDILNMKNRNVKNLDLPYLKIHEFSISKF
jgi:hypothetical protein